MVAGVLTEDSEALRALGVRDSKRLSPQRRRGLAAEIQERAACHVVSLPADALDAAMAHDSLNEVEARAFAEVVRALAPEEAVVDCCDPVEARFRDRVLRHLGYELPLRAEHRAEDRHPVVAAASIVAKVKRDEAVERIGAELGVDVGSGYAHDARTLAFLEAWLAAHQAPPPHVRRSWRTTRRLLARAGVRKLTEWE